MVWVGIPHGAGVDVDMISVISEAVPWNRAQSNYLAYCPAYTLARLFGVVAFSMTPPIAVFAGDAGQHRTRFAVEYGHTLYLGE